MEALLMLTQEIINRFIENAEDLDIVRLMYNLFKYSDHYSMTSESLRNCCKDKANVGANENNIAGNYTINNRNTKTSKLSEFMTKITKKNISYFIQIIHRSCCSIKTFQQFLEISWFTHEISRTLAVAANPSNLVRAETQTNGAEF